MFSILNYFHPQWNWWIRKIYKLQSCQWYLESMKTNASCFSWFFFFNSIEIRVFSSCKQMNSPLRKDNIARSVKDEKRFKISISKVKISSALSRLNSPTYMIWYLEYQIAIDGKGIAFYDLGIWYVCIFLEQNVRN